MAPVRRVNIIHHSPRRQEEWPSGRHRRQLFTGRPATAIGHTTTTEGWRWWSTLPVMRDIPFFPDLRAVAVLSAALPIFRPEKPD